MLQAEQELLSREHIHAQAHLHFNQIFKDGYDEDSESTSFEEEKARNQNNLSDPNF